MELLERESELQMLAAAFEHAAAGHGRIALVSGEAGIGKTSFVERFITIRGQTMRILKGNCDALFTPSPLGPLYDIARQTNGRLLAQLEDETPRAALFSGMLDQLRGAAQPILLVIEDIHWADEATLDLIKFLSRRIAETKFFSSSPTATMKLGLGISARQLLGELATSRSGDPHRAAALDGRRRAF